MEKEQRLIFDPVTRQIVVEQVMQKRAVSLDEFYRNLSDGVAAETPILPRGTRLWRMNPKASESRRYLIIIEREPGLMNFGFGNKNNTPLWTPNGEYHFDQKDCRSFKLSMPWVYFWFECSTAYRISNVGAFVSKKPLQGRDDWVMKAPFPNISGHAGGGFCTGTISVSNTDKFGKVKPLGSLVMDTLSTIHDSTFNYDYGCYFPKEVIEETYARNGNVQMDTKTLGQVHLKTIRQISNPTTIYPEKVSSVLWPTLFNTWHAMSENQHQIATTWHYSRNFQLGEFLDNLASRNIKAASGEWI